MKKSAGGDMYHSLSLGGGEYVRVGKGTLTGAHIKVSYGSKK